MLEGIAMEGTASYIHDGRLTSTVHSQFHTMESLDDRFRCLMDRSFQFVKKCGDFAAALPNQASEDSGSFLSVSPLKYTSRFRRHVLRPKVRDSSSEGRSCCC